MTDPSLLIPAIIVFIMLVVGLLLTMREFHQERGLGKDPVEHVPKVVKPSPDQVRQT